MPIPKLCTLVVASAFDAAIHDAYGKAFGLSVLRDLRSGVHERAISRTISARRSRASISTGTLPSAPGRACRSFTRSARAIRSSAADVRTRIDDGLPEHARGVDSARRPDPLQDQAQRRQPRRRLRARRPHRSHRQPRAGGARRARLEVLARLQRRLPERRLPARVPAARPRGDAERIRSHPLHRAADGARPATGSRQRDARGGASCAPSSSTSR